MESCDVLIVGGGPAGSTCAWRLASAGVDVVVLDKAVFPRDKVCAGWITPAVVDELQLDVGDYRKGRVFQPFTGFLTGLLDGRDVFTQYHRPVSFGIRRCEFDAYLLHRSGARLACGQALSSLERDGNDWVVNDRWRAPLVIGAGGYFCPVARKLAVPGIGTQPVVTAQEIEFELSPEEAGACPTSAEAPELYFCPDLRGYAWIVRKGNFLNVGLGREGEPRLAAHVAAFQQQMRHRGRLTNDPPRRYHGHAYKIYLGQPGQLQTDRALLIGDAAGLAYPQSGEGIRPAIESGLLAARAYLESRGNRNGAAAAMYQRALRLRFGAPPANTGWHNFLPRAWVLFAARRLMATRWFSRRVLLDRWFLHAQQRPLEPWGRAAARGRQDQFAMAAAADLRARGGEAP